MTTIADLSPPPAGWPPARSLYLHVPFCRHRCGYCNFSVVAGRDDLVERFLMAIDRELEMLGRPAIDTLFIGGGTPNRLSDDALRALLATLDRHLEIRPGAEWTLEANPEEITETQVAILYDGGVNRVSLGVQSFRPDKLKRLERGHSPAIALRAIETVSARIGNVSLDLIFAAPGESPVGWRQDLNTARHSPITHLSAYALTYEKGAAFWGRRRRGTLHAADEALELEMFLATRDVLRDAGWEHYEVSNFARDGQRCRHNEAYWQGQGWYAIGPGAAAFLEGRRTVNHRSTTTYLKRVESGQSPLAESEAISAEQYAREVAAFGLRMLTGIDPDAFSRQTGFALETLPGDPLGWGIAQGLLTRESGRVRLTGRGLLFADSVAAQFLG